MICLAQKSSNKPLKVTILILGGLLIATSMTPYINSYLLTPKESDIVTISSEEILPQNPQTFIETSEQQQPPQSEEEIRRAQLVALQEIATSQEDQPTLPALNTSDDFILENPSIADNKSLFVSLDIIRNIVVFIDNFARGELVSKFSPLQKPEEQFSVAKEDNVLLMNDESYHRYDKYAQAIDDIDTSNFMYLYALLSPLIDEAYQDIGYPSGSFNQTFIKAIEHLLDTPVIRYKIELTSPSVMYQYADQSLEDLPDTQKLMLRMGPDNLQTIKFKLREIQNELQRL
ncbi:DUF3014 domain-containing protein [Psychromonas sp. KJ10-10]|uniref:DUF3014 domain-containing protein n=1 Tax=Psychromonas sp. KJ10-10 TaxID=3391823 RepID=UPI0039B54628